MGRLIVDFRGICTHFHNIVPGVPHRVVLPNGTPLRFGLLDAPGAPTLSYFVPPHIGVLRVPGDLAEQAVLTLPGVMLCGLIYTGVRFSVANGLGQMAYDPEGIPCLNDYVSDYVFADEVVLGGRALAYFDLFSGTIGKFPNTSPSGVRAVIETDGPPVLHATRFFAAKDRPELVMRVPLPAADEVELIVANIGPGCDGGSEGFDFLLHYMTAKGGIPRTIHKLLPGMSAPPRSLLPIDLGPHLERLAQRTSPHEISPCDIPSHSVLLASPNLSCSDTRYP